MNFEQQMNRIFYGRGSEDDIAPQRPKVSKCIECGSEYCHGVCVERGDEHYDRDHPGEPNDYPEE